MILLEILKVLAIVFLCVFTLSFIVSTIIETKEKLKEKKARKNLVPKSESDLVLNSREVSDNEKQ